MDMGGCLVLVVGSGRILLTTGTCGNAQNLAWCTEVIFRTSPLLQGRADSIDGGHGCGHAGRFLSVDGAFRQNIVRILYEFIGSTEQALIAGAFAELFSVFLVDELWWHTSAQVIETVSKDIFVFFGSVARRGIAGMGIIAGDGIITRCAELSFITGHLGQHLGLCGDRW